MKILYVSPNGFLGGAEKLLVMAVRQHRLLLGEEVATLFFNPGVAADLLRAEAFSVQVLKTSFKLRHLRSLLKALTEIRASVRSQDIKIIHSTMAYGHLVMTLATLGLKVKRVWFQHGPVSGWLDKLASLLPVDVILFNSRFLLSEHQRCNFDLYRSQKRIIRLGVDQLPATPSSTGRSKIEVLMVGRISPGKGFHVVLEALKTWVAAGEDWIHAFHFTLLGSATSDGDRWYQNKLEDLGKEIGPLLTLVPFSADVSSHYARSEVLIQPSLASEGFGLVLAEAMAAGLLVIGPTYGGGTEILRDGETGYGLDFKATEAPENLKTLLKKFHAAPDSFNAVRAHGKSLITETYTVREMMDQLNGIYGNL